MPKQNKNQFTNTSPWNWMSRGNGGYFVTFNGVEVGPNQIVEILNNKAKSLLDAATDK